MKPTKNKSVKDYTEQDYKDLRDYIVSLDNMIQFPDFYQLLCRDDSTKSSYVEYDVDKYIESLKKKYKHWTEFDHIKKIICYYESEKEHERNIINKYRELLKEHNIKDIYGQY